LSDTCRSEGLLRGKCTSSCSLLRESKVLWSTLPCHAMPCHAMPCHAMVQPLLVLAFFPLLLFALCEWGHTPDHILCFACARYHVVAGRGSGEFALRHLLEPGAWPKCGAALEDRLHDLKVRLPLTRKIAVISCSADAHETCPRLSLLDFLKLWLDPV
jgi:hypothetical protein